MIGFVVFLFLTGLYCARKIYITSPENCNYSVPLGSCEAPFCSLDSAFLYAYPLNTDSSLEFIILVSNLTYSPDNSSQLSIDLFREKANASIRIRPVTGSECNLTKSQVSDRSELSFDNYSVVFWVGKRLLVENLGIIGENLSFIGNSEYRNATLNLSMTNISYYGSSQSLLNFSNINNSLSLTFRGCVFAQASKPVLTISLISKRSDILIDNSTFWRSGSQKSDPLVSATNSTQLFLSLKACSFRNSSTSLWVRGSSSISMKNCFFSATEAPSIECSFPTISLENATGNISLQNVFFSGFNDNVTKLKVNQVRGRLIFMNGSFENIASSSALISLTNISELDLNTLVFRKVDTSQEVLFVSQANYTSLKGIALLSSSFSGLNAISLEKVLQGVLSTLVTMGVVVSGSEALVGLTYQDLKKAFDITNTILMDSQFSGFLDVTLISPQQRVNVSGANILNVTLTDAVVTLTRGNYYFWNININNCRFPVFLKNLVYPSIFNFKTVSLISSTLCEFLPFNDKNTVVINGLVLRNLRIELFNGSNQTGASLISFNNQNSLNSSSINIKNLSYSAEVLERHSKNVYVFSFNKGNTFILKSSIFLSPGSNLGLVSATYINSIEVFLCSFEGFDTHHAGGGIFVLYELNSLVLNLSKVQNNQGGGLLIFDSWNLARVLSSSFQNLSSKEKGGIMILQSQNTLEFSENTVTNCSSSLGGMAFLAFENTLLVTQSNLTYFHAYSHGGAFFLIESNILVLENVSFQGMGSKVNGGTIYFSLNNQCNLSSFRVNDSWAGLFGGVLHAISQNVLNLNEGVFENSGAGLEGAGLYVSGENTVNITKVDFLDIVSRHALSAFFANCFNNLTMMNLSVERSHGFKLKFGSVVSLVGTAINVASVQNLKDTFSLVEFHCEDASMSILDSSIREVNYQLFSGTQCRLAPVVNLTISGNSFITGAANDQAFITLKTSSFEAEGVFFSDNNLIFLDARNSNVSIKRGSFDTSGYLVLSAVKSNITLKSSVFQYNPVREASDSMNLMPLNLEEKQAGFIYLSGSRFSSLGCTFQGGRANNGAAIFATGHSGIKIKRTLCLLNWANLTGGCVYFTNVEAEDLTCLEPQNSTFIQLSRSIFLRNQAFQGGHIFTSNEYGSSALSDGPGSYAIRTKFLLGNAFRGGAMVTSNPTHYKLINCRFEYNFATEFQGNLSKGGAIYSACGNAEECEVTDVTARDVSFISNKASIGGAIFLESLNPLGNGKTGLYASENRATYSGRYMATSPAEIKFLSEDGKRFLSNISFSELMSGATYEKLFCFVGIDIVGQQAYENELIKQNLVVKGSQKNAKLLLAKQGKDRICATGTLIDQPQPNYAYSYQISYRPKRKLHGVPLKSVIRLTLEFRACDIGERETDDHRCEQCPVNTYSFEKNSSEKCKPCRPDDDFICYGASYISPKPGYWRQDNSSNNFIKCPNPSSCLGYEPSVNENFDLSKSTGLCRKGYTGVVCAECEEGYGVTSGNYCTECASVVYYFYLFGFLIIRIVLLIYSLHRAVAMCASSAAGFLKTEEVISSTIIKILINHLQVLNIIVSFPFEWNHAMFDTVTVVTGVNPNISESYSWTCLFRAFGVKTQAHYLKIVTVWLSLLFLLAICYGYYRNYLTRKIKFYLKFIKKTDQDIMESTYVIILFICYSDFVTVALETFGCKDVGYEGHSNYRMVKDYSIRCWEETHQGWGLGLVIPYLVLFGFGFPVLILGNIVYHFKKKELNNKDSIIKYGFFYLSYENKYFYWDFVILIRKIILSIINTFIVAIYSSFFSVSVMFMLLILLIFLYLQVHCNPFLRKRLHKVNLLEKISLISLSGTMFLAILSQQEVVGTGAKGLLLAFSLIFNLIFLAFWLNIYYISDIRKVLRRCLHIFVMIVLYLINKIKLCCERRPINSVKFERRTGFTGGKFIRKNDKRYLHFEPESGDFGEIENMDGIKKKLPQEIDLTQLDLEYFSLDSYHKLKKKNGSHITSSSGFFANLAQSLAVHKSIILENSLPARIQSMLREGSPIGRSLKKIEPEPGQKLKKGRTFMDESEDIKLENKVLKYKFERQAKELQDLKYQLRMNKEASAFRSNIIEEKGNEGTEEYYEPRIMNDLVNSNYYMIFLQKLRENLMIENNFMCLVQNEGVLLRTRSIEISYRNFVEKTEYGGLFLRYVLLVVNLEEVMLENLWLVFKQPALVESVFPEITCLNMVPSQTISQDITLSFKNAFITPIVFDISFSVEGSQFVYQLVLPNTVWKFISFLPRNPCGFREDWKSPLLMKLKGRKTNVGGFSALKKILFVERIFKDSLIDLKPDEEFDDELTGENQAKKLGFAVKNELTGECHQIVMKFARKRFAVHAKVSEFAGQNERIFIDLIIETINTAFSFMEAGESMTSL